MVTHFLVDQLIILIGQIHILLASIHIILGKIMLNPQKNLSETQKKTRLNPTFFSLKSKSKILGSPSGDDIHSLPWYIFRWPIYRNRWFTVLNL
jgi:hypothetical protein